MPRPTHKLRVTKEISRVFADPSVMLNVLRHGRLGEDVVVEVDDATWEQYRDTRGSVQERRMRDVLALEAIRRASVDGAYRRAPGTLFVAERETICPFCNKPVGPDVIAVRATLADRSATRDYHVDCANAESIPFRATDGTLNAGLVLMRKRTRARIRGALGFE